MLNPSKIDALPRSADRTAVGQEGSRQSTSWRPEAGHDGTIRYSAKNFEAPETSQLSRELPSCCAKLPCCTSMCDSARSCPTELNISWQPVSCRCALRHDEAWRESSSRGGFSSLRASPRRGVHSLRSTTCAAAPFPPLKAACGMMLALCLLHLGNSEILIVGSQLQKRGPTGVRIDPGFPRPFL